MSNDPHDLIPPLRIIYDRLTANARERRVLRALERLAVRAEDDRRRSETRANERSLEAAGRSS